MALGDPLNEGRVADPGPIGERPLPVLRQRHGGSLGHRLAGQDVGAGRAACERDRVAGHYVRP